MNPELEAVTEFLTGSRIAPDRVPWRLLRREDIRVIGAWAAETQSYAGQRSATAVAATCCRRA
jgi:hypothetical protein